MNMLFDPVEAAKAAILAEDADAVVYTEPQTQDVRYPCYFVSLTKIVRRPVLNRRFVIEYSLTVRRYAAQHADAPYAAARVTADRLAAILRVLSGGGFTAVASDPEAKVEDGDAVYTAVYRIRVREPDPILMQTMEVK